MKFGDKLKQLRIGKGWTQADLAKELYVSRSAVAKWEQGRGYPSLELLEKLSDIFDYSIDDFLDENEYRGMTLKSDQTVKSHSRFNKIIMIIGGVLIVMTLFLLGLYFNLNNNDKQAKRFEKVFYGKVEVKEGGLDFTCAHPVYLDGEYTFSVSSEEAGGINVYDKFGKNKNIDVLRSGYKVKISLYTEKRWVNVNDLPMEVKIYRVDIIDDYVEGDYYTYGFFLSAESVTYEQAPVYDKKKGNEEVLEWAGEAEYLGERYPYFIEDMYGYTYSGSIIQREEAKTTAYMQDSYEASVPIERTVDYNVTISCGVGTLYVYVLDTSEKGYSLVEELSFDNIKEEHITFFQTNVNIDNVRFMGYGYNNEELSSKDSPDSLVGSFHLNIVVYNDLTYVEIEEYDKNHTVIHKTQIGKQSDIKMNMFITQDDTRYIKILGYATNSEGFTIEFSATRGDTIKVPIKTYYGFIITKELKVY
ncbi:MAG: helix-turn-helix transcriptional regulator [Clostridia bacterium]|nr:helix-turn-helix transcriptional regulator [Clostridia bacterium]